MTAPTMASPVASLAMLMRALKLPAFARYNEEVAQKAEREGWTFGQFLHHLAELEVHERRRRRIERYLKDSDLPSEKTLATLTRSRLPPKVGVMIPTYNPRPFFEETLRSSHLGQQSAYLVLSIVFLTPQNL